MNNDETGIGETHTNLAIRQTVVAGDVAGPLVVPGWIEGSSLKSVINLTAGTDLTDEFQETATGIDNAGGTSTATSTLLVLFVAAHPKGGSLTRGG
jgi:hypothetical protein